MKKASRRNYIGVGSVVVLKSGSLPMTVSHLDGETIWADYWDGEKIKRYVGDRVMFKATDKTVSVQGAMKLVSQRRAQLTKPA